MKKTGKLTFQKKEFRVLDPHQLSRIKGGDDPDMILKGSIDDPLRPPQK